MRNTFALSLTAILSAIFGLYFPGGAFAFSVIFLGLIIGLVFIHVVSPDDAKFLMTVFLLGFSFRILLALGLYFYALPIEYVGSRFSFEGFFIGDGWGYYTNGWLLNDLWERGFSPDLETFRLNYTASSTVNIYDYFNAHVIRLTAKNPLIFFFINCFLGAFSTIVIYLIAFRIAGKRAARNASLFFCFWPSLLLWSTQNLKEPLCDFLVFLIILNMITLMDRFRISHAISMLVSSYVLILVRKEMLFVIAMFFLCFYLILVASRSNKISSIFTGIVIGVCGFFIFYKFYESEWIKGFFFNKESFDLSLFLEKINISRSGRAYGGSAIFKGLEYASLGKLLLFMPAGFIVVFFMPFPWQIGSTIKLIALPEMLAWYILFPFTFAGILISLRRERSKTYVILAYIFIMAALLGLIEGNVGTLFRHRSSLFALCLIFTGTGVYFKTRAKNILKSVSAAKA